MFANFDILTLFIIIFTLLWFIGSRNYNYWSDRNVFSFKPFWPFIGNLKLNYLAKSNIEVIESFYKVLKESGKPYAGFFILTRPVILMRDPEYIKKMLVTDFNYFTGRGFGMNIDSDPLCRNLIHVSCDEWKHMRSKLQAPFGIQKWKTMVPVMDELAKSTLTEIERGNVYSHTTETNFEAENVYARYSIDLITRYMFGLDSHAITLNEKSDFYSAGREVLDDSNFALHILSGFFFPKAHGFFKMRVAKEKQTDFFLSVTNQLVSLRGEKSTPPKNDFLDVLIDMVKDNREKNIKNQITHDSNKEDSTVWDDNVIAANIFMFFVAGYDSASKVSSFLLYELAINEEIQAKARSEAQRVIQESNNEITMEALHKMKYLDQIISETNRKYPALLMLFRKCDLQYKMPDGGIIEPGTPILIPSIAMQYDSEYFSEPDKFDPDRFNEENKSSSEKSYYSFGIGPRTCIAKKFANNMIKVLLARILLQYKIGVHQSMKNGRIKFNPRTFLLKSSSGVYISYSKIDGN